mmetsp:Transcript_20798/g.51573  ORF Transcript_20798/g.51573 Transcript_20798/m.51573 type:complete len:116 (-) Transcript_20798:8-355(-)
MVAVSPKHDRNCKGSFLLTPSKYRRTTSSALVSEGFAFVVPVIVEASVSAFNTMVEERVPTKVENADTQEVCVTSATNNKNACRREFRIAARNDYCILYSIVVMIAISEKMGCVV